MNKEIRSTIYLEEDLYKRFREACNKKFGDKQGKIKQGYVLAITNFANEVLQDVVDIVIEMKPKPDNSAKKLNQAETVPQDVVEEPEHIAEVPQNLTEIEIKTPQQVIEESLSTVDTPLVSAKKLDQANEVEIVSVDKGLQTLVSSLQNKDAIASVQLDQDTNLKTITEPLLKSPEELEKDRLDKVREDQRISKIETTSHFVAENSPEAKAKRNLERLRKQELE